jgi:hypothetical protein
MSYRRLEKASSFVLFPKYNWNEQFKKDDMERARSTNGERRNAYRISVEKPEG